jgi:CshA-type fibril repeat protein
VIATNNQAQANGSNPVVINVLSDDKGDLNGSVVYLLDSNGSLVQSRLVEGEGVWSVNDDQRVTFTPQRGYIGTPTPIDYVIRDRNGNNSNRATITIVGACSCDPYEASISVMSGTSAMVMWFLTLLLTMLFFKRDEKHHL